MLLMPLLGCPNPSPTHCLEGHEQVESSYRAAQVNMNMNSCVLWCDIFLFD